MVGFCRLIELSKSFILRSPMERKDKGIKHNDVVRINKALLTMRMISYLRPVD